jgi:hypothetical protein
LSLELSSGGFSTGAVAAVWGVAAVFEVGVERLGGGSEAASGGGARFSAMRGRERGGQRQRVWWIEAEAVANVESGRGSAGQQGSRVCIGGVAV